MKEYIINAAITGAVIQKKDTPFIPITTAEILRDAIAVIEAGASIVHLHVRDDDGKNSLDPARYGLIIKTLRKQYPHILYTVSCSGRYESDIQKRCSPLYLAGDEKPDMASLTLSSMNFYQGASVNSPETVQTLARTMLERGIKPELEVFDIGMIQYSKYLIKKGLLKPPYYYNILLGNIAGLQPNPADIAAVLSALPEESIVCLSGLGEYQLQSNLAGLLFADGIRIGLEDNIYMNRKNGELATNRGLIERFKASASPLGWEPMTPTAVRRRLKI